MFENPEEFSELPQAPRPKTAVVLMLIVCAAGVFSYLIAYAVMNALAANGVISPINHDADPRPKWMLYTFVTLVGAFFVIAFLFRFTSNRQMSAIDRIADSDE